MIFSQNQKYIYFSLIFTSIWISLLYLFREKSIKPLSNLNKKNEIIINSEVLPIKSKVKIKPKLLLKNINFNKPLPNPKITTKIVNGLSINRGYGDYYLDFPNKTYYSQHEQDMKIFDLLNKQKNGFFIEIGGYDGEKNSNTLYLEKSHGWTGLLIETNPYAYQVLLSRGRKIWSVQTCLSVYEELTFKLAGDMTAPIKYLSRSDSDSSSSSSANTASTNANININTNSQKQKMNKQIHEIQKYNFSLSSSSNDNSNSNSNSKIDIDKNGEEENHKVIDIGQYEWTAMQAAGEIIRCKCTSLLPILCSIFGYRKNQIYKKVRTSGSLRAVSGKRERRERERGLVLTVDVLSVDVEAGELDLLKSLEWDSIRFRLIVVEAARKRSRLDIKMFLATLGYVLVHEGVLDDFYMLKNVDAVERKNIYNM